MHPTGPTFTINCAMRPSHSSRELAHRIIFIKSSVVHIRVGHGKWIMMAGQFFDGSYIYKQDLIRVFFIIHHLPSQFCRFLRDKNGKKWQISAGYNSCYSGSILLGVVTR